jgi:hypothetical protein
MIIKKYINNNKNKMRNRYNDSMSRHTTYQNVERFTKR